MLETAGASKSLCGVPTLAVQPQGDITAMLTVSKRLRMTGAQLAGARRSSCTFAVQQNGWKQWSLDLACGPEFGDHRSKISSHHSNMEATLWHILRVFPSLY